MMARKVELLAGYWTIAEDRYPMGPSEVSPFSLRERAEAASAAGYTGMGLVYQDIMANAEKIGLRGIKQIFDDNGIVHVEVEFLGDWFESGAKKAASDRVKHDLLEAAAALGARDLKIAPKMYAETIDIPRRDLGLRLSRLLGAAMAERRRPASRDRRNDHPHGPALQWPGRGWVRRSVDRRSAMTQVGPSAIGSVMVSNNSIGLQVSKRESCTSGRPSQRWWSATVALVFPHAQHYLL